ncbi:MAG: ankyrin repeat domain-containing protein [Bacteroidia bacterium]
MNFDPDIFDAIEVGDLNSIEMYWTENIDIDYQDNNGQSMLMLAAYYGFQEIVEYLLKYKPTVSIKNKKGETALDIAKNQQHFAVLDILKMYEESQY